MDPTGVFLSRGGPGLRPPKDYGRSGRTARYGPQVGEGVLFWYTAPNTGECKTNCRDSSLAKKRRAQNDGANEFFRSLFSPELETYDFSSLIQAG